MQIHFSSATVWSNQPGYVARRIFNMVDINVPNPSVFEVILASKRLKESLDIHQKG